MKILTKKKQEENLKRLTALLIILNDIVPLREFEGFDKSYGHILDIAYDIGGPKGMDKVHHNSSAYIASKNLHDKVTKELNEMKENGR